MSDVLYPEVPLLRLDFSEEDIKFVQSGIAEILNSGYLTMGRKVKKFENIFSDFTGVKYAIGVNSGTSALEIILRSLDVKGKSVIVPTITITSIIKDNPGYIINDNGKMILLES